MKYYHKQTKLSNQNLVNSKPNLIIFLFMLYKVIKNKCLPFVLEENFIKLKKCFSSLFFFNTLRSYDIATAWLVSCNADATLLWWCRNNTNTDNLTPCNAASSQKKPKNTLHFEFTCNILCKCLLVFSCFCVLPEREHGPAHRSPGRAGAGGPRAG